MPGSRNPRWRTSSIYVSQSTPLPVKMEVAKTGTEVVVQAEATAVQTESVELKKSVIAQHSTTMPLPTRNPLDLVKSFAGIMTPNNGAGSRVVTRSCTGCAATPPT